MTLFTPIVLLAMSVSAMPQEHMPYAPATNSYSPANYEYAPVEPAVSADNRQDSQSVAVGEWYNVAENYKPALPERTFS